jgi:hypothetical protein
MKRISLLFLLIIAGLYTGYAKQVDQKTAKTVARNFYSLSANVNIASMAESATFTLAHECKWIPTQSLSGDDTKVLYYIFNINTEDGFVIIAGDDIVSPVLGYSVKGAYTGENLPRAFVKWMENYKQQVIFAIDNHLQATSKIDSAWAALINNQAPNQNNNKSIQAVNPLCTTTWDQQPYYNVLCPYDAANTTNQHAVTGCPATAMAQIMKYWNYPANGSGFHSYNHPDYGTLSANFGSTTYNWGAMPNNVTSNNLDVATLMYHCGVAVDMQYGANSSGGYVIINSPTPTANCEYAYKTYFGYNPATIQGLLRNNYTNSAWINLLKNELNNSRPIQYAGFGTGGGHTFVCDGYDASDFFHMNWGWSGYYDGYFIIDALNPGGTGTGGGTGGYNANQQAVIGIQPLSTGGNSVITMYSSISVSPNPIDFAQPFTVNADIINNGTSSFSGDYCAALFNANGDFIDYVEILSASGSPLQVGYHYTGGLTFSNSGVLSVPGTYQVGIYYRDPGGSWKKAGDANYYNPVSVNINSPENYMQQYSAITCTPASFVQGQSASVNVNLVNDNSVTYYGQYAAVLYDLNGNYVETIGTINESNGLLPGYTYLAPYLTFTSSAITAAPGTYILAIQEYEVGASSWYLVGGQYYPTPINIDVVAPAISPDNYEFNDNQSAAYTLSTNWSGNTAHPLTTGANIHVTSDYDFYKINLAGGYSYNISARVHDSYNSGNGNTYTNDVIWSYNTGAGWSMAYDDVMPGNLSLIGPATVYFQVAPYFIGQIGTYLLDIQVNRSVIIGIDEPDPQDGITIYPNPATNFLVVKSVGTPTMEKLRIVSPLGQIVKEIEFPAQETTIDLSSFPAGVYYLEAMMEKNIYKKRFVVSR